VGHVTGTCFIEKGKGTWEKGRALISGNIPQSRSGRHKQRHPHAYGGKGGKGGKNIGEVADRGTKKSHRKKKKRGKERDCLG